MEVDIQVVDDEQITLTLCPDRDTEYEIFLRRGIHGAKKWDLSIFERGDTDQLNIVSVPGV